MWMPQELLQEYWGLDEVDTCSMVAELHRRHLVEVADKPRRIKPHDLQRDYLLSKAAADPASLRQRHVVAVRCVTCTSHIYAYTTWAVPHHSCRHVMSPATYDRGCHRGSRRAQLLIRACATHHDA